MLAGCGDGGIQDVKQWMDETRANSKVEVPKVEEPKKFTPFNYAGKNSVDPYDPTKLAVALAKFKASTTGSSGIKPNLDRRREPLESYPLDSIHMVGTLQKPGLTYAILQVDKAVFQAKVGNYVGQNMGLITRISDEKVELKEIIQDASGEWVERKAILELQEAKK
jgi:type IV pilus assembly protein PilP